jgi:hypothetical protein
VIGNIVTGTDAQTDVCLNARALEVVVPLLNSVRTSIVKEVCWLISNIAAGNENQIQAVLNSGCVPKIVDVSLRVSFFFSFERPIGHRLNFEALKCEHVVALFFGGFALSRLETVS